MDPETFLKMLGWIEIGTAVSILVKPLRPVLLTVVLWELFVGSLFPISGLPVTEHPAIYQIFRTLERFGDYAGPFGILLLMTYRVRWTNVEKAAAPPQSYPVPSPAPGD